MAQTVIYFLNALFRVPQPYTSYGNVDTLHLALLLFFIFQVKS